MSLFKDDAMRTTPKAKFKNFLLKNITPSEPLPGTFRIIPDGGTFLWCCKWRKKDLCGDIFQKYVDALAKFGIDVVVFDGCAVLTKDCTHQKQTGKRLNIFHVMLIQLL